MLPIIITFLSIVILKAPPASLFTVTSVSVSTAAPMSAVLGLGLLERGSTLSCRHPGLEPSPAAGFLCDFEQITVLFWPSASVSVKWG